MPTNTTRGRQAGTGARFARQAGRQATASGGRFARPGAGRSTPGRGTRPGPTGDALAARVRANVRRSRRPQQQQSGIGKLLGGLAGGKAAKRGGSTGRKGVGGAGGLALLAAGAGLALKNRDKLGSLLGRSSSQGQEHEHDGQVIAPAGPTQVAPATPGDADRAGRLDDPDRPGPAL
jgi:hypothetical protein